MTLDAIVKFVIVEGGTARCRIDFPRVPDSGLDLFTRPGLLRLKCHGECQDWLAVEVSQFELSTSSKTTYTYVAAAITAPAKTWMLDRSRPWQQLYLRVELERMQRGLFHVEREEIASFINQRSTERRIR